MTRPARPKCQWCGKPLVRYRWRQTSNTFGFDGHGLFCTQGHGYRWAIHTLNHHPEMKSRPREEVTT